MKQIIIEFDDEHDPDETVKEVLKLVEQGYTSGYYPTWEITEHDDHLSEVSVKGLKT